jgi:hypothetical protein
MIRLHLYIIVLLIKEALMEAIFNDDSEEEGQVVSASEEGEVISNNEALKYLEGSKLLSQAPKE